MCGVTHSELVDIAAAYAKSKMGAGLVLREHKCDGQQEIVDVAVFRTNIMINIEVKVTRSDFLKDKNKPFRKHPETGMGHYRFYCAPVGLISPDELPDGWGLLEYHHKSSSIRLRSGPPLIRSLRHEKYYITRSAKERRDINVKEVETLKYFFEWCNEGGHADYLYSAHRRLIMAVEEGVDFHPTTIFEKPNLPKDEKTVRIKCS